jgi:hypothetical protein
MITVAVLAVALWVSLVLPRYLESGPGRGDCEQEQRLYDSQASTIDYIGRELAGPSPRTDLAIESLREELGLRPVC